MIRSRSIFLGLGLGAIVVAIIIYSLPRENFKRPDPERILKTAVPAGATFSDLAREWHIATDTANAILKSAKEKYDLAKIVQGRELAFVLDTFTGDFKKLTYKIDADSQLIIATDKDSSWKAEVAPIPYEIREKEAIGVISQSLYEAMQSAGLDDRLTLALAETFAWQIDFAADVRRGDKFKVIYEDRYLDGQYVMPGKILAADFENGGEIFKGFYFSGSDKTRAGYYDENGNALQKVFLKSPLQYKYISSGFSYARFNPVTKKVSPHRGIDYAAPAGTPAVAVGDGTVIQAGWNGPYGISAMIRHNDTYTSRYGHFSRLAKGIKVGAKVRQGQVVGYVGSTGEATGPHLHYEMHKFSAYVNPFKLNVPPGQPVAESDREVFLATIAKYIGLLTK